MELKVGLVGYRAKFVAVCCCRNHYLRQLPLVLFFSRDVAPAAAAYGNCKTLVPPEMTLTGAAERPEACGNLKF